MTPALAAGSAQSPCHAGSKPQPFHSCFTGPRGTASGQGNVEEWSYGPSMALNSLVKHSRDPGFLQDPRRSASVSLCYKSFVFPRPSGMQTMGITSRAWKLEDQPRKKLKLPGGSRVLSQAERNRSGNLEAFNRSRDYGWLRCLGQVGLETAIS